MSADARDALLVTAADALARTADADADDIPHLLDAARSSVSIVRSVQDTDVGIQARTDFLESVAQVAETTVAKDQPGLDAAHAQALTHALAASAYMPAHEWLPLAGIALRAPSSVMLGPVIVDEALRPEMQSLFPKVDKQVQDHLDRLAIAALAMFNRGRQDISEDELGTDLKALDERLMGRSRPDEAGQRVIAEFFFVHAPEARMLASPTGEEGRGPRGGQPRRNDEFMHATFGEYLVASRAF